MVKNLRVHISPLGFEHKRVTDPLIDMRADKVYIISFNKDDPVAERLSKIEKELKNNYPHIQLNIRYLNIWDLYDCIKEFREIIHQEIENHVYINISTGTKITAVAGMLSCMLWKSTPYYVQLSYNESTYKQHTEHIGQTIELPRCEIIQPTSKCMKILDLLDTNNKIMRKSKIIDELTNLKILRQTNEKGFELTKSAQHNKLRILLKPMSDLQYIKIISNGSRSEVKITKQGKEALKIFGNGDYKAN